MNKHIINGGCVDAVLVNDTLRVVVPHGAYQGVITLTLVCLGSWRTNVTPAHNNTTSIVMETTDIATIAQAVAYMSNSIIKYYNNAY